MFRDQLKRRKIITGSETLVRLKEYTCLKSSLCSIMPFLRFLWLYPLSSSCLSYFITPRLSLFSVRDPATPYALRPPSFPPDSALIHRSFITINGIGVQRLSWRVAARRDEADGGRVRLNETDPGVALYELRLRELEWVLAE